MRGTPVLRGWEAWGSIGFLPLCNPRAGLRTGFHYLDLMKSQWLVRENLEALQFEKTKDLIAWAKTTVPHYASARFDPNRVSGGVRELLADLPVLTKEAIRSDPPRMLSAAAREMAFPATTGGTTGNPITVWKNLSAISISEAAQWRGKTWLGIRPWDKGILAYKFGRGSWYGNLRTRMTRKWGVEVFCTSEESRRHFHDLLRRVRPRFVEGFITDLLQVGGRGDCSIYGISDVITTGEMLYEHQREALQKGFSARVSDYYGSNEVNSLAFECAHGRKHVTDEHVVLETVDEAGNSVCEVPGRLLVTDLDNRAMPLIRYELGDTGILTNEPCPCGRTLTVLKALLGRTQEALCNESGCRLSAIFFAGRFKELKKIRSFQLVQRSLREVDLFYEMAEPGAEEEASDITAEIRGRLGAQMKVRPRVVPRLERTEAGKCPLVIGMRGTSQDAGGG